MAEEISTLDKIKTVAKRIFGLERSKVEEGTGYQRSVVKELEEYDRQAIRTNRISTIKQSTEMVRLDARCARLVGKLASDAAVGGVNVVVESGLTEAVKEDAQNAIDELLKTCKVNTKLRGWIKSMLKEGDDFLEVIVDESERKIIRLKKLAASITWSNMNSEGNFPQNKPAYYQTHPFTQEQVKTFEGWQICQISWDKEDGHPYGTPLLAAARLAYERLDASEKNMVIRRATRAGRRLHHKVGTPDKPSRWTLVNEYKNQNRDAIENPMSPVQDYFSNGIVDIEEVGGDTELGQMADIEHFEGMLAMVGSVPMALLGGGRERSINRDVLEEQEEDYYRVIADISEVIQYGLSQIIDFALLLAGINNESIEYSFHWGAKDRDDIDAKIARGQLLQALGFSFETIFNTVGLEKLQFEDEIERISKQLQDGAVPYGLGAKLDPNLVMYLMGIMSQAQEPKTESIEALVELLESYLQDNKDAKIPLTIRKALTK